MGMIGAAVLWTIRVFLACAFVASIRIFLGPRGADRLTALAVISALVLGALVLYGVSGGRSVYLDVALLYDIFGFLGIMAISAFMKEKS